MTLDVYSHVMLDEPPEALAARWSWTATRAIPVMPQGDEQGSETRSGKGILGEVEDTGIEDPDLGQ